MTVVTPQSKFTSAATVCSVIFGCREPSEPLTTAPEACTRATSRSPGAWTNAAGTWCTGSTTPNARALSMLAPIGGEELMSDEQFAQLSDATRHFVATAGQSPSVART